jgi:His/Glu/Gln/Arg/opine family amino acid ABC transporter permease subunit
LLTALSMPTAVIFGLFLAMMRRSRHGLLSWPAAIYIEFMRGTPLLVQIWLVYFTLPQIGLYFGTTWLVLPGLVVGVMCLAGNYAAYEAEIHRAGLEAIDRGQREAALSIGMSEGQAFFRVVLPQAFRIVVPPIINDLIAMLKDSCLVSVVGVRELLNVAQDIGRGGGNTAQMLVLAAMFYLALSVPCYFLGKYIQRRLKVSGAPEVHIENVHGH